MRCCLPLLCALLSDCFCYRIGRNRIRPDGLTTTGGHLKNLKEEEDEAKRLELLLRKVRLVRFLAVHMPKDLEETKKERRGYH